MIKLEIKNLTKKYPGSAKPSVDNYSLTINEGEMIAFLGPSGCGKTTTLKMIAGLLNPTSGDITFNGKTILSIPPEKREIGMVFQKPLLFPHMSIYDNIAFGLKMRKVQKDVIDKKVREMLKLVKLEGYEKRKPTQLSGGQEQRVSLARGLVIEPKIFLLDEPLSSLDAALRIEMRGMILSIQRKLKVTSIFVTHDQEEAVMLADKIALMFEGKLQQFDEPEKFYQEPKTRRVAEFFGCSNFLQGTQKGKTITTKFGDIHLPQLHKKEDREVYVVVRNESFEKASGTSSFEAKIKTRIFMGTSVRYIVEVQGETFHVTLESAAQHKEGEIINLKFIKNKLWVVPFDKAL